MIKILILFAIVLLSGGLGYAISAEIKKEKKIFAQFYDFNEKLILNLKFSKEKVSVVAEEFEYVKKAFGGDCAVKGDDGRFLEQYLNDIGKTDAPTQLLYLNEKGQTLLALKQKSEEKYKKYGSLYFKLSIMAGILIAVLLA